MAQKMPGLQDQADSDYPEDSARSWQVEDGLEAKNQVQNSLVKQEFSTSMLKLHVPSQASSSPSMKPSNLKRHSFNLRTNLGLPEVRRLVKKTSFDVNEE